MHDMLLQPDVVICVESAIAIPGSDEPRGGQFQFCTVSSTPLMNELPPILVLPRVVSAPRSFTFGKLSATIAPRRFRACAPAIVPTRPSDVIMNSPFPTYVTRTVSTDPSPGGYAFVVTTLRRHSYCSRPCSIDRWIRCR